MCMLFVVALRTVFNSYTLKTEVIKITLEASFLTLPKSAMRDNTRSVTQTPRGCHDLNT